MVKDFLHGVEVSQAAVIQPATDVNMSIIGVIGIAPYADPEKWPLDTPILVTGSDTKLIGALTASAPTDAADTGTLPAAFATMLDECSPVVVAIRVDGKTSDDAATIPNITGGIDSHGTYRGVHAFLVAEAITGYRPRLLCAPGYTHQCSNKALVNITVTNSGRGYTPGTYTLTLTDNTGNGAAAQLTISNDGSVSTVKLTKNGSGYTSPTITIPAEAGNGNGAKFTADIASLDNAVIAELKGIAERLRAVIFADGPNTTLADAIAAAAEGGARVMLIDPWIVKEINGTNRILPPSAKFAARQAWVDQHEGFWRSLSNHALKGIAGLARPVDFVIGDTSCVANMLNAQNVTTIIRRAGTGYLTWGNRALDGSFLCVTRTIDKVNEALLEAVMQFVDVGINRNFVTEVIQAVNNYLRQLQAKGAITGGKCWADTQLNTASAVTNGQVFFDFDIGPVYPAERITFRSSINDGYVTTIFSGGNA